MAGHKLIRIPKGGVLYDPEVVAHIASEDFEPGHLQARGLLRGVMNGRGQVQVLEMDGTELVLRHFHRGGMLARLGDDAYLWTGLRRTRAFREWHLLQALYLRGLPVPRPAAARVQRSGILYRGDIMTVRLPATESLAQRLGAGPLPPPVWAHIGATLRRFHRAGAYHADLNAMNILLDAAGECHVIDWDKGRLIRPRRRWRAANLQRLRRSLQRLGERGPPLHFRESDWAALLAGYDARSESD